MAARGSRLSISQASLVIDMLYGVEPDISCVIQRITTRGDTDSKPLFMMDRRGIFEREVNAAVADGRAHFAVHSMKDVPNDMSPGLVLASVPARADPYDVMVCRPGLDLEGPFVVGTSSLRRAAQARMAFGRCEVRPIRGNVETRISKVGGLYDAVILARAGLRRLGLDMPVVELPHDVFIPSPGQGALAIVCRADDHDMISLLRTIQDGHARAEAEAERALSGVLESGCRFPVAACARHEGHMLHIRAAAYDGAGVVGIECTGSDPVWVGERAGHMLLEAGAASFALKWRGGLERHT